MVFWYGPRFERFDPIVVKSIIIANIAVFILELINPGFMFEYFALKPNSILHGAMLWTLVTHMFMHADFLHIFFNMYALYIFGPECERVFGRKAFLILYLFSGLLGALMHVFLCPYKDIPAVGASGAIFGILGAYAILYPRRKLAMFVFLAFVVLPAWEMIFLLIVLFTLFAVVGIFPTISHFAHIGGIIGGIIFVIIYRRKYMRYVHEERPAIVFYTVEYGYEGYEDEDYDYEYY